MTKRKPAGMSFHSWIDQQVETARDRGDFDDLPGRGKPIEGLDKQDRDWWIKGLMAREGLDFMPETLRIRRDLEKFFDALPNLSSERAVLHRVRKMNERIREANSCNLDGPPSTVAPLDAERVVRRWRLSRRDADA